MKVSSLSAKAAATGETRQQPGAFCFSAQLNGVVPPWVADRLCCVLAEAQGDGGLRVRHLAQFQNLVLLEPVLRTGWLAAVALYRPGGWTYASQRCVCWRASCQAREHNQSSTAPL